jgi:spore germination protein KA
LRINTSLVRRKIKDPRLWLETISIGSITKTNVTMMYLNGIAKPSVIDEARSRLKAIDIDGVLEGGYIEEQIEDSKYSIFPTVFNTELPDSVAAQLLEGKVAILVDGTPNVLLVPTQFVSFVQSSEDYYQRALYSSLLRLLRFVSGFISLLLPSLYIAITTFHRDMLPTSLLISLAAQREGVPFPAFIEAVAMEITFEILREAGLRMPRAIGQAVSVVGTLVIGQAAVEAGIVSAAMVIVVSVTAISTFTVPAYSMSIPVRMLRFAFMGLAASFGLFGIIMGFFTLLLHLCSLRSFGEPYMAPLSPFIAAEQQDALIRLPRWLHFKRPSSTQKGNRNRQRKR